MNKTRQYIITAAIVSLILFSGYTIYLISRPIPNEVQGQVEATQIKVASKLIGRIDSLAVHKGQDVRKGDLLYIIDSPDLNAKLQQAQAARSAAQSQQNKATNGARSEDVDAAYNNFQKAQAAANYAKKTYARINNLFVDGVVTEQKKDEVETKMMAAVQTEMAAKSIYEKAKSGARIEDKQAAGALVNQAQGVVNEVSSYLDEITMKAPISGEIANIISERGELVPAGYPVITIVNLEDVWISFNLNEKLLADISKGSIISAKIPALGNKIIDLKITYINVLGSYATWNATKTSGDFDMKTFEVHARPVDVTSGLRPGMSALVNWDEVTNSKG